MSLYVSNYFANISVKKYISNYRDVNKFLEFCKLCNKYNNCWACPPYEFDTDKYISCYNEVYIIGTKILLSKKIRANCKNAEESRITGTQIITEIRKILDDKLLHIENDINGSKAFFAGTCHLCDARDCTRSINKPCCYPDKIRPSLESFGFDIGKTTEELLDIELKWSNDGSLPEYLTLVSGLFTYHKTGKIEDYFTEIKTFSL